MTDGLTPTDDSSEKLDKKQQIPPPPDATAEKKIFIDRFKQVLHDDFNSFELYILKCHLIVEHELTSYIETVSSNRLTLDKKNFTFNTKFHVSKMLALFDDEYIMEYFEPFIIQLNKVRNQISHSFLYKEKDMEELLTIVNKYQGQNQYPNATLNRNMMDHIIIGFGAVTTYYKKVYRVKMIFPG